MVASDQFSDLLININKFNFLIGKLKEKAEKTCKDALSSCSDTSHSIEIHYEEDGAKPILARVHFPYKAELREEVTELVRWNINRDSMEDKQRALLDLMPALKKDVLHQVFRW